MKQRIATFLATVAICWTAAAVAQPAPLSSLTATWDNAGTQWTGIGMTITNTASGALSDMLFLTETGASNEFAVDKWGNVRMKEKAAVGATPSAGYGWWYVKNTTPSTLVFVDDAGGETTLGSGGGAFTANGDTEISPTTPIVLSDVANDEAALTISYETNKASGTNNDTGLLINMTDTLSPGTSLLADFQRGGTSYFSFDPINDQFDMRSGGYLKNNNAARLDFGVNSTTQFRMNNGGLFEMSSAGGLVWTSGGIGAAKDLYLYRDAANVLAQRNSTNAQTQKWANTWTDGSNYEYGFAKWNSNVFEIGTENAGTGSARAVRIVSAGPGGVGTYFSVAGTDTLVVSNAGIQMASGDVIDFANTTIGGVNNFRIGSVSANSSLLFAQERDSTGASIFEFDADAGAEMTASSGTQSYMAFTPNVNQSGTAGYTGILLDVTETATGSGSNYLMDLQANSSSVLTVTPGGVLTTNIGSMLKLRTPKTSELTIASGVVTAIGSHHTVDTEADAVSDDLDTINSGSDGMTLVIRAADSGRTVVVKDGTGNIQSAGDFSMDNAQDVMTLMYVNDLSAWVELSRSDNGA